MYFKNIAYTLLLQHQICKGTSVHPPPKGEPIKENKKAEKTLIAEEEQRLLSFIVFSLVRAHTLRNYISLLSSLKYLYVQYILCWFIYIHSTYLDGHGEEGSRIGPSALDCHRYICMSERRRSEARAEQIVMSSYISGGAIAKCSASFHGAEEV